MRTVLLNRVKVRPMNLLCLLAVIAAAMSGSLGQLLAAALVLAIVGLQLVIRHHRPSGGSAAGGFGAAGAAIPWGSGSPS